MATVIYKDVSPYMMGIPPAHASDFRYARYSSNMRASSRKEPKMKTVGMALFGLGRAGSIHLENLIMNPRVNLLYIVEEDSRKCANVQERWERKSITFLTPLHAHTVYEDPRVHAIVVATPTYTHEEIIVNGLRSGKAVFSEKPVADDARGVKQCYSEAGRNGQPLFCAFNRRFDPSFRNVYDRVHGGELGQVHVIKTCSRDSPIPSIEYLKISGGILHDCSVHDIDIICWILGEYPTRVITTAHAHIKEIADINDHDTVAIVMTFPSGTIGIVDLSRNAVYGYDQRLEVFGPKGMLVAGNQHPINVVSTSTLETSSAPIYYSFPSRYWDGYYYEMEHFLNVVQGYENSIVTENETLAVIKTVNACKESLETGAFADLYWKPEELNCCNNNEKTHTRSLN